MCKAQKVATAQCSMIPESVAVEYFPDVQATQGKTRERLDGGVGGLTLPGQFVTPAGHS
jgi:hypothetical protein